MADLVDTGAAWPAGIYQIETTDPVLGGVPNPATGAGMSNIPHLQLAQRSQVLKGITDAAGLGAAAVPLVTLNSAAARLTGTYRFTNADAATPATGVSGTVQVIAASATAVNQIAHDSAANRSWTRFWNGTVWSTWKLVWGAVGTTELLAAQGWQRLPSGQLEQWGSGTADSNGRVAVTFPTAFATATYIPVAMHAGTGPAMVIEDGSVPKTTTGMTLRVWDSAANVQAAWIIRWRAIGW